MKTYKKRIGFLISAQHLIAHGGIGQFCKGFCELLSDYQIDILLDKQAPNTPFVDYIKSLPNVSIVEPLDAAKFKKHTQVHAFSESLNLERMINFRDCLMQAHQTRIYDSLIINTPEALFSTYALGIQDHTQIIFYTHNENLVFQNNSFTGVFNDSYDEMILKFMGSKGILVGTQTERNLQELSGFHAACLPMPVPERTLLEPYSGEKNGVLFIGRWEDRKNPKEFLRVIAETGFHAKVMTNDNGAKQFEKELKALGVTYDIRASITGTEKVDFIRSSKVFYMPSKSESYGFALMEAIGHTNAVVLEDYPWYENFDTSFISVASKKTVVQTIRNLYNVETPTKNLDYIRGLDSTCREQWINTIESFSQKKSNSNAANITKVDDIYYSDFIKSLGRFASIEDVISVLSNRHKFTIMHTENDTFLSKSGKLPVARQETITMDDIF